MQNFGLLAQKLSKLLDWYAFRTLYIITMLIISPSNYTVQTLALSLDNIENLKVKTGLIQTCASNRLRTEKRRSDGISLIEISLGTLTRLFGKFGLF